MTMAAMNAKSTGVRQMIWWTVLVLLHFAADGLADPINPLKNPRICGRPDCPATNQKFRYNNTIQYTYSYRTHVRTEFLGSGQDQSDLYVDTTAILQFPRPCEGVLRFRNVQLADGDSPPSAAFESDADGGHPQSAQFAAALELADLRFAYHDGRIEEVCPSPEDTTWVLNFKRGALSVLQNSMLRFDIDWVGSETDVAGRCDVEYRLLGAEGTSLRLQKSKELATCAGRYKTNSFLQTVPYRFRQNVAVWPILKSTSSCNISVDHNIYSEVKCYERHQLEPFSNKDSGAVTHSHSHLLLLSEQETSAPARVVEYYGDDSNEDSGILIRTNLLFDHYPTPKQTHDETKDSRDLLIQMCSTGFPNIQREFIAVYTQFLHTSRHLSYSALRQLLIRAPSMCGDIRNGRYHVLEALQNIGSSAAVRIMCDEIIGRRVPVNKANNWLSSMVLLNRPDEEMLEALRRLMTYAAAHENPRYILVATAVAHTFCRTRGACEKTPAIRAYVAYLEAELKTALVRDLRERATRERIVVLLKGIGNVGVAPQLLGQLLQELVHSQHVPTEFRLHAIYAHIRLDCRSSRNRFLDLYENHDENAELRIAAYQQVMRCPSKSSVKRIKTVLQTEEVNQVGSYVWSSLKNLAKSGSPLNVEVQSLLVDEDLSDRFKLDVRKFSRNFEQSLFFDEYNMGTRFDADLIFGTESYMPRKVGFNLTADLFGESINLFELSARMEGLEQMAERTFGPGGSMSSKYFSEKYDQLSKLWSDRFSSEDPSAKLLDRIRIRRATPEHHHQRFHNETLLADLYKSIGDTGYQLNYTYDHPRVALSTKMFGNDIGYHTIDGEAELLGSLLTLNPMRQLQSVLGGRQINYTKSGVMMDISYEVPLSVGLPLSIHAFGATSVDVRISGALREADTARMRLNIGGRMKASAALEITATMRTDYFVGAGGVRVKGNMYTSSAVDADLRVEGAHLVSLQLSLPQDRNELFSARSELLVMRRDVDVPQSGIQPRYSNATCTWSLVERAVGLKVCSEYSVPDVSSPPNGTVYPSLLLSGPVELNIRMDKADVSAKTFAFEYRWNETAQEGRRNGSLSFHTPGSKIVRVFSANVTSDRESYNATMSFRNGPLLYLASGTFRVTENEKRIDVYLELDKRKMLACEMALNRTAIQNGWMYTPRFVLSINESHIAGLAGYVKATMKKNIAQYYSNLTFETKRAQANLQGYITKSEFTTTPKLTLSYQFKNTGWEYVEMSGELSSRGQKSRTEYTGHVRLNSTAYPNFNFASHMKFISLLGHVDASVDYNNAPDLKDPRYLLTLRSTFTHNISPSTGMIRTTATLSVTRPRSNIDFSVQLKNEEKHKNGDEHNVFVLVRVAPQKQGTATLSVLFPRSQFFAVDAALNITVPAFDSCTVALRWIGTRPNEYTLDFRGAWFTGHSLAATGLYQDLSAQVKIHKHLKLLVSSPHFNETNVDVRFARDEDDTTLMVQVEHGSDPYALEMKHLQRSPMPQTSYLGVTVIDKLYSVRAQLVKTSKQQLTVEIHVDNIRDVHIALRGHSTATAKEFGVTVQWDANRDPTQHIALTADLNTPHSQHTDGSFVIAYPDRTFSGTFDIDTGTDEWCGKSRVGWSSSEAVAIDVRLGNSMQPAKQAWLLVHLTTPFADWESNRLRTNFYYHNQLLRTNGSVSWGQGQRVAASLATNYLHSEAELLGEFRVELNSTVPEVPTAVASFRHHHRGSPVAGADAELADAAPPHHVNTDVHVRHSRMGEPAAILSATSKWTVAIGRYRHNRSVQGSVRFRSPLTGYRLGGLYAQFRHSDDQRWRGGVVLDLESHQYRANFEGYAHRLLDNMFTLNVTTPIEKFARVVCRLGVSDEERHAVAEVRLPASALGVEMLWQVDGLSDFSVLFSLETPMEAFQRVMLVGKMRADTVDMRGAWNRIVLGYVGVWRMASYMNVEYSYRVFTPLEGFEENGLVVKFVVQDGVDVDLSGQVSKYKIGIIVSAKPKPPLRALVGTQPQRSVYFSAETNAVSAELNGSDQSVDTDAGIDNDEEAEADEDDSEADDDDYVPAHYVATISVDTLVWPTVVGHVDLDEIDDDYIVIGSLKLPNGVITLKDRFEFPDYANVTNTLKISTPFEQCSEVNFKYVHGINVGASYATGVELSYRSQLQLVQFGAAGNYSKRLVIIKGSPRSQYHQVQINLSTPFPQLERIQFHGDVANELGMYRGNVTTSTPNTRVSVAGKFGAQDGRQVDIAMALALAAPTVPQLYLALFLKRQLSEEPSSEAEASPSIGSRLAFGFRFQENNTEPSYAEVASEWRIQEPNHRSGSAKVETNLCALRSLEASGQVDRIAAGGRTTANAALKYSTTFGEQSQYLATATRYNDDLSLTLQTPAERFGNITLLGQLRAVPTSAEGAYRLFGTCTHNSQPELPVSGTLHFNAHDMPVRAALQFQAPAGGASIANLEYSLESSNYHRALKWQLDAKSGAYVHVDSELSTISQVNWRLGGKVQTSAGILGVESNARGDDKQSVSFSVAVKQQAEGTLNSHAQLETPWRRYGMDAMRAQANVTLLSEGGAIEKVVELPAGRSEGSYTWTYVPLKNMQAHAKTVVRPTIDRSSAERDYEMSFKYVDYSVGASKPSTAVAPAAATTPQRVRLGVGVALNIDNRWTVQSNGSWRQLPGEIGGSLNLQLPADSIDDLRTVDLHQLSGKYRGNLDLAAMKFDNVDVNYDVLYETDVSKRRFSSRGQYRNVSDVQGAMRVEWGRDAGRQAAEANVQMLRKERRREFSARMATPWHVTEDTMTASGVYDVREVGRVQVVKFSVNYPASREIANTDVSFTSFENMKGYANCTTPFANLTWLHGEFDFLTTGANANRFLKATWPSDNAYFDLRQQYSSHDLDRDLHGVIKMSAPLATRHNTEIVYGLKDRPLLSTGNCAVRYNDENVLDGQYKCKYEERAGYSREVVDISLQNPLKPLGIAYVHVYNYSDEEAGLYDMKRAEVFDLVNHTSFNITGEFHVRSTFTGQDFTVIAVHPNRKPVVFSTMYDQQERHTRTNSKLLLTDDVWLAYNLLLQNETSEDSESRSIQLQLSYPRRNLSTTAWYAQAENSFDSDIQFEWTADAEDSSNDEYDEYSYGEESTSGSDSGVKTAQAALKWRRHPSELPAERNQTVEFSIYHPSFERNVSLTGGYHRSAVDLFGVDFSTEYCNDADHRLDVQAVVRDLTEVVGHRNYTFGVTATHKATELELAASGSVAARPGLYEMNNQAAYKRSYLPVQEGFMVGKVDVRAKEVHFWKSSPHKTFRLWAITDGQYPVYRLNGSFENSPDVNSTGRFYVNIDDRYIALHVNMTPDAAQNLRMVGTIPDARGANFDLWRDYDEFRVVDVAYYLRMNHSRLVTSKLVWRPTIKAEVTAAVTTSAVELYESIAQTADYWLKTLYTETKDTVSDVWEAAKPYTQTFLDDVHGLGVLESDLGELRVFLNQSYEANDFYVKSMVNMTMTVLDELSLRNHIDSVPKILSEIWQMLGETGQALRKSLIWVMESLKTSYDKALEMVGRIFKGDAMTHLTALMERGIAKYDKIVKDLHVSFIKYVEKTWVRITDAISNYWQASLQRIEPTLMQFFHYMESMVWNVSKEMFDFLYKRTNEIVDSPYFAKVSNFTQDMDTLYRDIVSHDVISNVRKYSALGWQFVCEKYFAIVPFGHELNEVISELVGEVRKLYTLEPVQYIRVRVAELRAQLEWCANELQLERRALQVWQVVRQKITTYGETALQTDDKYREAKTLFVFDPDVGLMELQQKLPMSWHAFNETPVVEEIQEYKTLLGFTSWFQGSNVSAWTLYNDYRQYADPRSWLPPYKAHAMIIGHRHWVTFDERFVSVQRMKGGAYLMAHDFLAANFTLTMEPAEREDGGKVITWVSGGTVLRIGINGTDVHIQHNHPATLPLAVNDIVISRDLDILQIESAKGVALSCNLRFDVCWFVLDGWYYGRTAGLLGNMNNELRDDYGGPRGQLLGSDEAFVDSWTLQNSSLLPLAEESSVEISRQARLQCDSYFHSKISPFASCFSVVSARPYLRMCLEMAVERSQSRGSDPTPTAMCSVSLAYIEACERKQLPLRVPAMCINCELNNGTFVPEGTFVDHSAKAAPEGSDVVFIVEVKQCNHDAFAAKNLRQLPGWLNKELDAKAVKRNRFAVVAYGATTAPYNTPQTVVHNNAIFSDAPQLRYYFEHIRTAIPAATPSTTTSTNHSSPPTDTFEAISVAAKLRFRPGAAKAFILVPCSATQAAHQQLDYSSVLQQLHEDAIQLHVLMDAEFRGGSDKRRPVVGIDRKRSFTRNAAIEERQTALPKTELGLCAALAMESSGSIFAGRSLRNKKVGTAFARRVAETAATPRCQTCECTGHNSGLPYMVCTACHAPSSGAMDYGTEDEMAGGGVGGEEEEYDELEESEVE